MTSSIPVARKLRSGGACQSIPNIFNSDYYRQILPLAIFLKVKGTTTINCDKINQLKFQAEQEPIKNLLQMRAALQNCSPGVKEVEYGMEGEKKKRKDSISINYFGQEILDNPHFLKQLDQFLLD